MKQVSFMLNSIYPEPKNYTKVHHFKNKMLDEQVKFFSFIFIFTKSLFFSDFL